MLINGELNFQPAWAIKLFGYKKRSIATSVMLLLLLLAGAGTAKVKKIGKAVPVRRVAIRNVAYNSNGTVFAVPNVITAGSVALFWVNEQGAIAPVPSRLSEKHFVRSSGLSFLRKKREDEPAMAFISLPEHLAGYAVDFAKNSSRLAIAGGERVYIYSYGDSWALEKEIAVATPATRAVFSGDGKMLAVLSGGKMLLFSTAHYRLEKTVEPAEGRAFTDVAFSGDNTKCALFEFRETFMDFGSRVRLFNCSLLEFDRDLPWFSLRPSKKPGEHLPLLTWGPGDSLLAVTLPATISGRVYLIKSNDGTIVREFKGFCHAFSPDGTLFVADNAVYSVKTWEKIGKISGTTLACVFSPTERVLVTVTHDAVQRFRIED